MNVYEVFLRSDGKDELRHAGAFEAPDDELALLYARECYVRRGEGSELWLVDRRHVIAATAELLAANQDRPHRRSDGAAIAARRRRLREGPAAEGASDGEDG